MFGLLALSILAAIGVNIFAIVDVARRSDREFKAVGSEKTMWLVLVLLAGIPAAIAYLAAVRPRLESAPPVPLALPGWYPDPAMPSYLRYHDGVQWTGHVAPMLPAAHPSAPPAPQAAPPSPWPEPFGGPQGGPAPGRDGWGRPY